jgi:diaminohydroxyphosphoribosylaminopyrimidine deaminase/5-amino-6-(5-phosphoribosylamino)uracil reductase
LVDELVIYLAPKIMGSDGRGLLGSLGLTSMGEVIDLEFTDVRMVGKDLRILAKPVYRED